MPLIMRLGEWEGGLWVIGIDRWFMGSFVHVLVYDCVRVG